MRLLAVLYFIYKMAFSDPNFHWNQLFEIDNSSSGAMVGDVFVKILLGFIFISFIYYQLKQAISEFKQTRPKKERLRLISLIWSFLFFPAVFLSLFNVNLKVDNTSIGEYLMEFYTVSTIIGVIAGITVIINDLGIIRQTRKNKNALPLL